MAEISFGLATSHTPMVNAPAEDWPLFAEKDQQLLEFLGEKLYDRDGNPCTFDELVERGDPALADEVSPERLRQRHDAAQAALARAGEALDAAHVDVAIVIGDDHKDVFGDHNLPAFAVYWSDTLTNVMPPFLANLPPQMTLGARGWFDEEPTDYPGHAELGAHLIGQLTKDGFDLASMKGLPEGQGMAHAFTFIHKKVMAGNDVVPMVPVFVNTFYPPNQPSVRRCYDLGRALRRAVDAWSSGARVAVIASGGLSHFVVHEDFDRRVIEALRTRDVEALTSLPERLLQSGNSEVKNWAVAAGALDHLDFELLDYIPCYRSVAGTGAGLAFATWS